MTTFFVMECRGRSPIARVELVSKVGDAPWMSGATVRGPGEPVEYGVHPKRQGNLLAMYELSVPLIREDLLDALRGAGADNLQLFPAVIRNGASGAEHRDYRAFNVLGVVSGADTSRSTFMHGESITGVDRDFAGLVLDETRIPSDLRLFRLAESVNAIVVHARVRDAIEARRIDGMVFYGPGEWSG